MSGKGTKETSERFDQIVINEQQDKREKEKGDLILSWKSNLFVNFSKQVSGHVIDVE